MSGLVALWTEFMDFHGRLDPHFTRSPGAAERWAGYITDKLGDASFRVLVAADGPDLAGYTVAVVRQQPPIWTIEKYGFIQEIAVAARFRRQGIARRLVQAAEDWLRKAGVPHTEVRIDAANEASQALFRSEGFLAHTDTLIKRY